MLKCLSYPSIQYPVTLSSEFSATSGTIVLECEILDTVGITPAMFAFHDNTVTGAEEMLMYGNSGARRFFVRDGAVTQGNVLGAVVTDGVVGKSSCTYAVNDLHVAVNGVLANTPDTVATLPTVTHLDLMRQDASQTTFGHLAFFKYTPVRQTDNYLTSQTN